MMPPNAFIGKPKAPTSDELHEALGPSKALWDQLVKELADESRVAIQEWSSYSRKAGWALRLKRAERTILYLSPCQGSFRASFALGDKAVQAARQCRLPARAIKIISDAKRYPEGTAVRMDVKTAKDLAIVKKLAAVKLDS
jgi:hypothetical protein